LQCRTSLGDNPPATEDAKRIASEAAAAMTAEVVSVFDRPRVEDRVDGEREPSLELVGGAHAHASHRYGWAVAPRTRRLALGAAAALVLAGVACAVLVAGVPGEILTTVLIAAGLGGGVVVVFLEIGFGEERDLAREEERKRKRAERLGRRRPRLPRRRGPD
jgi:hypothetical protein